MTNQTVFFGVPAIDTMLAQLGGMKIFAMAFDWRGTMHNVDMLTLKIARPLVRHAKGKATHVIVRLAADDTYTIESRRYGKLDVVGMQCAELSGVHAGELRTAVESMIGLQLSLGTMGAAVSS